MNETDDFTYVQRRLCAVMAKSEWTSSRMRMQKSGEELRERRTKSHQNANKFLQELLDKRTDSDLIDDNGVVDRYHKFVKYKSALNDDTNSTLDEFDRRLRALNNNRQSQENKLNNENINTIQEKQHQQLINYLRPTIEIQNEKKDINIAQIYSEEHAKPSRILTSIASIPVTSTPNDTTDESIISEFHCGDIQELSNVQSANISFIDGQAHHIDSSIDENHTSLVEKANSTHSSKTSLNDSLSQILHIPKACRADGTKIINSSSSSSLSKGQLVRDASNFSLFNQIHFPRSLTSSGKLNTCSPAKRQLPSISSLQSSDKKEIKSEQFDSKQLYDLLDHLDNDSSQHSHIEFTQKLNQLNLSTVIDPPQDSIEIDCSMENLALTNQSDEDNTLPNLFTKSIPSTQEKLFYTTFTIHIDDPTNICLYTMTLSTLQISSSILVPYSILSGRRPLLKCSEQTHFQRIRSKQQKNTCQVTAIESSLKSTQLQQNDIVLKINDQSVWGVPTDRIMNTLKQHSKKSNKIVLLIARLSQPIF